MRHEHGANGKAMQHREADKWLKTQNRALYTKMPSAMSQRTTQICGQEWKSFYNAIKAYRKNPANFKARPQSPQYANKATTVHIGRNGFRIAGGTLHFAGGILPPIKTQFSFSQDWNSKVADTIAKEIRIVPLGRCFAIEIIYNESKLVETGSYCLLLDKSRQAGIDLGINNLMAIATNQHDIAPALAKGTALKSINAWYNKRVAVFRARSQYGHIASVSQKRNRRIKDAIHRSSHFVRQYCLDNNIGTVVIGHNAGWKQNVNIGKINNQKFVAIPHTKLIDQLKYKLASAGVTVIVREESYTSKASSLDNDAIPTKTIGDNIKPLFSGKRIKRGLYKSKIGSINADVNAALNILRKESGEDLSVTCRGVVYTPVSYYLAKTRIYDTKRENVKYQNAA